MGPPVKYQSTFGLESNAVPVTTVTYNMWGEPETSTEAFGLVTRTKKLTYDEAGRPLSSEETSTSSTNTALPKVTDSYSETTGQLLKQSTTVGEETQTLTSVYDRLGRLTSYTDAENNTTTYEYEPSGDGRLMSVTDAKGSQSYAYSPTTGVLTKLLDSAAGTFSASYDVGGDMTSETYPNGMTATYARNAAGETVGIEYVKSTHCTEKCTWFSETTVPSIHGETLLRSSTLAGDTYTYDAAGRLTQTTETPTGKGCTTRIYAYDEDSNRTSLTTREPGMEGKCATEGGSSETHTYDADDRLIDSGVSYDPLGDIAKLPAADGGGHELASEYYVDGQVQKQSQNGQTNTYTLDPEGRILKTVGEGTTKLTTIDHYDGSGEAVTWKEEGSGKYTRLIPGIEGGLSATQTNGETPILQLHDLQGDVVATAALSETETKLLTTYNSTEFGVPVNGTPPTKYSWLGSAGVSSELSSGALIMGTVSYVPQLGRALQTQPVIPPGAGVKSAEGVPYTSQVSAWSINSATTVAQNGAHEYEIEQQKTEQREAEEKACPVASMCGVPEEGGEVDPIHEYLLTPLEAIEFGESLCICATMKDLSSIADEIFGEVGGEVIKLLLDGGILESFGVQLYNCGESTKSNSKNRCRITLHTIGIWTPFGTIDTWIPTSASVDACYFYKKSYKEYKRGLNCPGKYYGEKI